MIYRSVWIPTDGTTGYECPAGSFCVEGSSIETPCPLGTFLNILVRDYRCKVPVSHVHQGSTVALKVRYESIFKKAFSLIQTICKRQLLTFDQLQMHF